MYISYTLKVSTPISSAFLKRLKTSAAVVGIGLEEKKKN